MKLWSAAFEDGHYMYQPKDDRYSKHDNNSEWNPSSFRDIQEYPSKLVSFGIGHYAVNLDEGMFYIDGSGYSLEQEPLKDRKLIYFREMEADYIGGQLQEPRLMRYAMGYEGKNKEGKVIKKVIYING